MLRVLRLAAAVVALVCAACSAGAKGVTPSPLPDPTSNPTTVAHWRPRAGATWQWQLQGAVDTSRAVEVYDVDWEVAPEVVATLHAAGKKVICYVSVGSWEGWRPDAANLTSTAIGAEYQGWPGEKHLDIRAPAVRAFVSARLDVCQAKGFDALEPDNMDVFELGAASGFPLTEADGIAYARWLAEAAHARGLGIGQKNAASITAAIADRYDWALTEDCWAGGWCGDVGVYVAADKPVFMCEYEASTFAAACAWGLPRSYSPILKSLELGAPITSCP